LVALGALMLAVLLAPDPAEAATFHVDSSVDAPGYCEPDGPEPDPEDDPCVPFAGDHESPPVVCCTCRAAWDASNANAGADTIKLHQDCILTREGIDDDNTDGDLDAFDDDPDTTLTVDLNGHEIAWGAVTKTSRDRVLHVPTPPSGKYPVHLDILGESRDDSEPPVCTRGAISGGYVGTQDDGGGCIAVRDADLHITSTVVSGCEIAWQDAQGCEVGGGGIEARGALTLDDSHIIQNIATNTNGGGILTWGDVTLRDSLVDGNQTLTVGSGGGLAICEVDSELRIEGSVIEDNFAKNHGGGFMSRADFVRIVETEIRHNLAESSGGGFWIRAPREQGSTPIVLRSLLLDNTAANGGALRISGHSAMTPAFSDIVIADSTLSQNTSTDPQSGTILVDQSGRAYSFVFLRSTAYLNLAYGDRSVVRLPSSSNVTFEYEGSILAGQCVDPSNAALSSLGGSWIEPHPPFETRLDVGADIVGGTAFTLGALTKGSGEPTRYHTISVTDDAADLATCSSGLVDQRNNARPDPTCDAGAYQR
jgi:hypothetical protein